MKEGINSIEEAYSNAIKLAVEHYENFPVISFFMPRKLHKHIAIIYWFARVSDDIADEGDIPDGQRIERLDEFERQLGRCLEGKPSGELWNALRNTINMFELKKEYFYDLLSAFRQDITQKRYKNFDELLDYCRRSANPVGRIILQLSGIKNPECYKYSDLVCTALQLINLYQDVSIDYKKGRIYIPVDEMKKFGVNESSIASEKADNNFKDLMKFQLKRNMKMFVEGAYLIEILPYKLKYQVSWTIHGGKKILYKIIDMDYDILKKRPYLSKIDYLLLMLKGLMG